MVDHKHVCQTSKIQAWHTAAVAAYGPSADAIKASHGGVRRVETCACGATRQVDVNGRWESVADWEEN